MKKILRVYEKYAMRICDYLIHQDEKRVNAIYVFLMVYLCSILLFAYMYHN